MRMHRCFGRALGISLLLFSVMSHATTVTYDIVGRVANNVPGVVTIGNPFSATLTYDLDAPSTSLNPPTAIYSPATSEFTFSVGNNNRFMGAVSSGIDTLQVVNDQFNGAVGDRFRISRSVTGNSFNSVEPTSLDLNLRDNSGDNVAFVGLDIPGVLVLADYDDAYVDITFSNNQVARVTITAMTASPVPIPAALPLFLSGMAGLGVMRRRKRMAKCRV